MDVRLAKPLKMQLDQSSNIILYCNASPGCNMLLKFEVLNNPLLVQEKALGQSFLIVKPRSPD
jgi:hypothetical protein